MSADTCAQIAFTSPRNAELQAVAYADKAARELAEKKAAAFDAMFVALIQAAARVQLANEEGDPILSAWLPEARAAIAQAEEATK